ncbi:MAG: hypothetical protein M0Z28_29075 [Rhodospirillales bacterium]|nr:hypothetical protein [Rhodospirillales bacterium]
MKRENLERLKSHFNLAKTMLSSVMPASVAAGLLLSSPGYAAGLSPKVTSCRPNQTVGVDWHLGVVRTIGVATPMERLVVGSLLGAFAVIGVGIAASVIREDKRDRPEDKRDRPEDKRNRPEDKRNRPKEPTI